MENLDCLYGIASRTQLSTLQLALLMRPLIKSGEIKMLSYQEIKTDNRPLVVCVNDRPAMQRILQYTLDAGGFRSLQLEDPFKALSILLGQKPKAILLDADMENISGYQLCSLCRKSGALNEVPIFILGENNGISERIRAKLSGASAYIGKPFLPNELLKLIDPSTNYAISA
jgi:CheY-like chemotaxis protein